MNARLVCLLSFQSLNVAEDGHAVHGQALLGNGDEFDNASVRRDANRFCHEGLYHGGVALVGGGLNLHGKRVDGENVGWLKGAAKQ